MKSERSEKVKKNDYSTKAIHKKRLCGVLFLNSAHREGMTEKEIHAKLSFLTNRTIFSLLKFQRQNLLNKIDPKIYSNEYTFHDELENAILSFGKVAGAFITYILIELLRPNERIVPIFERTQIFQDFLQRAFNLQFILPSFLRILPGNADRMIMGSDNKSLNRIENAYDSIYPDFRELLDDSFIKYVSFDRDKSCDHDWRKIDIHKIGKRFECVKCLGLAEEQDLEL